MHYEPDMYFAKIHAEDVCEASLWEELQCEGGPRSWTSWKQPLYEERPKAGERKQNKGRRWRQNNGRLGGWDLLT